MDLKDFVKRLKWLDKRFSLVPLGKATSKKLIKHPDLGGRPVTHPVNSQGKTATLSRERLGSICDCFRIPNQSKFLAASKREVETDIREKWEEKWV